MKVKTRQLQLTVRDIEIFKTLSHGAKTIEQLLRHSCRYTNRCDSYEGLRRRLATLVNGGLVTSFRYYAPQAGLANYYKLSRTTYRLMYPDCTLPGDAYFNEIKFGSQIHSFAVHEFLSILDRDATAAGYELRNLRRDGEVQIELAEQKLIPDSFFQLVGHHQTLNYYLEMDCGTEPLTSSKSRESLARKIKLYDQWSLRSESPFRVLFVFSSSHERRDNFLDVVYQHMLPPYNRTLVLATMMAGPNNSDNLVRDPVFLNHAKRSYTLGLNNVDGEKKAAKVLVSNVTS